MNSQLKNVAAAMLATLLAGTVSTAVAADDEHAAHHPVEAVAGAAASTAPSDAMTNMKKMQEQMAAIRATKDPKQRTKLLDEHMQTMQSTMQMMQQGKGCPMMDMDKSGTGGMMKGESGGGMNMMQMMMDQMMQHQKAMQGTSR